MVKAMGRQRRGSKTGGVEPATVSGIVLAAIAGVAGYGSTQGELSESDQLKVEAAVRARLEIERRKNPRSGPCPDFKSERDRLLGKLAEYESSETRFRLATPDQIVKVVETVKEKLGVAKKGGTQEEAVKEIEEMQASSEPTSVATSELVPVAEPAPTVEKTDTEPEATAETPAAVEPVTETPAEKTDTEPAATAETPVEPVPNKPTADIPMTAELLPQPDLVKAGVILDSIPKAFSRPRLITVLIKLESATREPLDTLRKYFDEAFAKLEPGSKTPLKDALRKMRERGVNRFFPKKDTPVVTPDATAVNTDAALVDAPVADTAVQPIATDTAVNTDAALVDGPVADTAVQPIATDTAVDTPTDTSTLTTTNQSEVTPPLNETTTAETQVAPVAETQVAPAASSKRTRRRNVQPGIAERLKELDKSGIVNQGGTRKKKLRTRRRDKQNVRRSSGRKNRSNRTDTYSSRRTEVDARGDELGL